MERQFKEHFDSFNFPSDTEQDDNQRVLGSLPDQMEVTNSPSDLLERELGSRNPRCVEEDPFNVKLQSVHRITTNPGASLRTTVAPFQGASGTTSGILAEKVVQLDDRHGASLLLNLGRDVRSTMKPPPYYRTETPFPRGGQAHNDKIPAQLATPGGGEAFATVSLE